MGPSTKASGIRARARCLAAFPLLIELDRTEIEWVIELLVGINSVPCPSRLRGKAALSLARRRLLSHFTPISAALQTSPKKAILLSAPPQSVLQYVRQSVSQVVKKERFESRIPEMSAAQEMDLFVPDTIWAVNWPHPTPLPPCPPRTPDPLATGWLCKIKF